MKGSAFPWILMTRIVYESNTGRQPHEILIAGICVFTGFAGLLRPVSGTISIIFTPGLAYAYFVGLIIAGGLILYGTFTAKILIGTLVERVGLILLTLFVFAYGVALVGRTGTEAWYAASFPISVALANCLRIYQINRGIKYFRAQSHE